MAGVRVIGVDEHRWAPRRVGAAGFVTLIIDLTPTHDHSGPARLLDLVSGRSATALATWLSAQPADFAAGVEVVAMDGFACYKTAATEVIPDAVTVMDALRGIPHSGSYVQRGIMRTGFSCRVFELVRRLRVVIG